MNVRALGALQWLGLGLGAAAWFAAHLVGFGITQAACGAGGEEWGISIALWEAVLMGVAAAFVLLAEAAAVAVFARTRGSELAGLPSSRMHFFATAAIVANLVFLMIVVLDGTAAIVHGTCVQS
jgi:hypothetical protein